MGAWKKYLHESNWEGIGNVAFTMGHFQLARSVFEEADPLIDRNAGFRLFFHACDERMRSQKLYLLKEQAMQQQTSVLALCAIGEVYRIGHLRDVAVAKSTFTEILSMNASEIFAKERLKLIESKKEFKPLWEKVF